MRKVMVFSFLAAVVLSLGCAVTNYPVIFDSRGADGNAVAQSFYDPAYIIPSAQIATIWADGSDELFSEVTQSWTGDQWLYTYNNFDPTASVLFLDQTYCDPVFGQNCRIVTSWNPDLPDAYPHGDQSAGYNNVDNIFDYIWDQNCQGSRSLSLLLSMGSRIGECGSGIMADKQGAAYEFSLLEKVNFRGVQYYHVPIDSSVASFSITGANGVTSEVPIFGRFNTYLDNKLHMAVPVTPNAAYEMRWLNNWVKSNGSYIDMNGTYGSLNFNIKASLYGVNNALGQM